MSRTRFLYLRFGWHWFMTSVLMALLFSQLLKHFGVVMPRLVFGVVPPAIASMIAGIRFARTHVAMPTSREAWHFAAIGTLIVAILSVLRSLVLSGFSPALRAQFAPLWTQRDPYYFAVLGAIFLIVLGVVLVINRLFFPIGVRFHLKSLSAADDRSD